MKKNNGLKKLIGLCAALGLCLGAGTASAADIAWDMVSSSDQNLTSYTNDITDFSSIADAFEKFTNPDPNIPWSLLDATLAGFAADDLGIIDESSDFDEFFGVVDTENNDNSGPVSATWVFDISSATGDLNLSIDMAAMGDFESDDSFVWTYQVDGGPMTTAFASSYGDGITQTYTMASGVQIDYADPLLMDGVMLNNKFQTLTTGISSGSQLTLVLTVTTNGGSEVFAARNILISDSPIIDVAGEPIPTLSEVGIVTTILLLMAAGIVLIRRLH